MHLALKSAMSRIPYTNKVGETLSSIADSAAAYSLRALGGGDPMVARVRRSSDDAEKDFTASDMDSGSVADWVGSGNDGFVTTWYDQSGNSNDATQSVAASQPKIVDAGVYLGELAFDGVDDFFTSDDVATSVSGTNPSLSIFTLNKYSSLSSNSYIVSFGVSTSTKPYQYISVRVTSTPFRHLSVMETVPNIASVGAGTPVANTKYLTSFFTGGGSQSQFVNGISKGTDNTTFGAVNFTQFTIGCLRRDLNIAFHDGPIKEVIVYNSDQSANRAAIETNINNYYDIY